MENKYSYLFLFVSIFMIGTLMSCSGKSGSSKNKSAADYPVVEISEGLKKATQLYSQVYEFHDGYAQVRGGDSYGIIDKEGNTVLPCDYREIHIMGEVVLVKKNHWGVVSLTGKEIVPCQYKYEDISVFPEEELIRIEKRIQEYHFINYEGIDITPNGLHAVVGAGIVSGEDDKVAFSEGLAATVLPSNDPFVIYGFVDKTGKVIPARYRYPSVFQNGLAWVGEDIINKEGKPIGISNIPELSQVNIHSSSD